MIINYFVTLTTAQKITVNKPITPKEYYINDIKLEPLTFYEQHNSWFMGEITDNKTKITNPCFKLNITLHEKKTEKVLK